MAYDDQLAGRVRRFFEQSGVTCLEKPMMGGLCFLVNEKMCVGVERNRLMARIGPEAYADALRRPGCVPMDFTGRPMRGFVFVNPEGLTTNAQLDEWLRLALKFNPQARSSKTKAPSARRAVRGVNGGRARRPVSD